MALEVFRVRQKLHSAPLEDPGRSLKASLEKAKAFSAVPSGAKVGIALGSRRIDALCHVVKCLISYLEQRGIKPVVIPAMGSHGSARPKGQFSILSSLGFSESSLGVDFVDPGRPVKLGTLDSGVDVFTCEAALKVDGIIPVNRVAPHTGFVGPVQSGILKMLSVGLGGPAGARSIHEPGFGVNVIEGAGVFALERVNVLAGVAIVEDGLKKISLVEVIPPEEIDRKEKILLARAISMYPSLPIDEADVLIVEEMGKDISGTGMDPLVIGRGKEGASENFRAKSLAVLSLTPASAGNATGVGLADVITKRLYDRIDFEATMRNVAASGARERAKIPAVAASDEEAIKLAIERSGVSGSEPFRLVMIKNTRSLSEFFVSTALTDELQRKPGVFVEEKPTRVDFDEHGDLISPFGEGGVVNFHF